MRLLQHMRSIFPLPTSLIVPELKTRFDGEGEGTVCFLKSQAGGRAITSFRSKLLPLLAPVFCRFFLPSSPPIGLDSHYLLQPTSLTSQTSLKNIAAFIQRPAFPVGLATRNTRYQATLDHLTNSGFIGSRHDSQSFLRIGCQLGRFTMSKDFMPVPVQFW
jgi:hypothetical protein